MCGKQMIFKFIDMMTTLQLTAMLIFDKYVCALTMYEGKEKCNTWNALNFNWPRYVFSYNLSHNPLGFEEHNGLEIWWCFW